MTPLEAHGRRSWPRARLLLIVAAALIISKQLMSYPAMPSHTAASDLSRSAIALSLSAGSSLPRERCTEMDPTSEYPASLAATPGVRGRSASSWSSMVMSGGCADEAQTGLQESVALVAKPCRRVVGRPAMLQSALGAFGKDALAIGAQFDQPGRRRAPVLKCWHRLDVDCVDSRPVERAAGLAISGHGGPVGALNAHTLKSVVKIDTLAGLVLEVQKPSHEPVCLKGGQALHLSSPWLMHNVLSASPGAVKRVDAENSICRPFRVLQAEAAARGERPVAGHNQPDGTIQVLFSTPDRQHWTLLSVSRGAAAVSACIIAQSEPGEPS